jgi:hypothetical protein
VVRIKTSPVVTQVGDVSARMVERGRTLRDESNNMEEESLLGGPSSCMQLRVGLDPYLRVAIGVLGAGINPAVDRVGVAGFLSEIKVNH